MRFSSKGRGGGTIRGGERASSILFLDETKLRKPIVVQESKPVFEDLSVPVKKKKPEKFECSVRVVGQDVMTTCTPNSIGCVTFVNINANGSWTKVLYYRGYFFLTFRCMKIL